MAISFDEVARLALAMPEAHERGMHGQRAWRVRDKLFVWERPLGKNDLKQLAALGQEIPEGPLLGVRTDGLGDKQALLETYPEALFTIPHFSDYPAVLARLDLIDRELVAELIVDAWLVRAPKKLADAYLAEHPAGD